MPDPTGTESFPEYTRVTRENSDRLALKLLAVAENIGHLHVFNLAVEVMFPSCPLSVDALALAFLPRIWLRKLRNIQIGKNSRDCVRMRRLYSALWFTGIRVFGERRSLFSVALSHGVKNRLDLKRR